MPDSNAKHLIYALRKRITGYRILCQAAVFIGCCMVVFSFFRMVNLAGYIFPACLVLLFVFALQSWRALTKITLPEVIRLLDRSYPELEESSALLAKPEESLNLLEKLQAKKTAGVLAGLPPPPTIFRKLKRSLLLLVALIALSVLISKLPLSHQQTDAPVVGRPAQPKEHILPELRSVHIRISAPSYTGLAVKEQQQFSIGTISGSTVTWQLETTVPSRSLKLIFSDKSMLTMEPANTGGTKWKTQKTILASGFYQVVIDGKQSDLYKLEIGRDHAPLIKITSPEQYSTIDFGQPQQTDLKVSVSDDYALRDAYISATLAKGQGEGVKFREVKVSFGTSFGKKAYQLRKKIDLQLLGMQPGDELYFYVSATDNHQQQTRSDVYVVTIQDTAKLMSMNGMAVGVSLVPEYFRSQRQIIIDTEKLLRERDTISVETFNRRSNNLGIDQKMLRLRYGKFLGEEDESNAGEGVSHEAEANESTVLGEASGLMDQYSHKHDQAEDATFFEPALKAQLKATLTEMWNSELRLRTYKPREALPYEYKALRLLKDLQQKSRAYVAKTALKTTPLKLEKRLTGELDKIADPLSSRKLQIQKTGTEILRKSIAVLAHLKTGGRVSAGEMRTLQEVNLQLIQNAATNPAAFLPAARAMRNIVSGSGARSGDFAKAELGIQKLLAIPHKLPQQTSRSTSALSGFYFKNLNPTQ